MSDNRWLMLLFFLFLCYSAAVLGSIWTSSSVGAWYAELRKPSFNPPNWIFAPVWSLLYFLMALSAWLVWGKADWGGTRLALTLFFAQLLLNVAWSWLFFGLRRPGIALVEIVFLFGAVVATALAARSVSGLAFWLMVPYALWVAFATLLNFKIWQLNSGAV
ncbi:MAG: tryptophan-rich sensory protein [Acidobacteriia bacterium]|nr:tryptophan-rich sensory protein [Terriglobia bacterium]